MAKIGVYIPKYMRVGNQDIAKSLNEKLVREKVVKVAQAMTDVCGGAISQNVTGFYRFSDGYLAETDTVEIYCLCRDEDIDAIADVLKPLVSEIRYELNQNSIGMYVNEDFIEL